jgi:hypothetical protein
LNPLFPDVVRLFEEIRAGKYEACTSGYTFEELIAAPEPKRGKMAALLDEFEVATFDITDDSDRLAALYVERGIIPERFLMDGAHIAIAAIHGLDCIISHNFQHINRVKTKLPTIRVNSGHNYGAVLICTAKEVLDDGWQQK